MMLGLSHLVALTSAQKDHIQTVEASILEKTYPLFENDAPLLLVAKSMKAFWVTYEFVSQPTHTCVECSTLTYSQDKPC
jgi:hypothetical protein